MARLDTKRIALLVSILGSGIVFLDSTIVNVALVGIENPRRRVPSVDCPGGALAGASADLAHDGHDATPLPEPAGAST